MSLMIAVRAPASGALGTPAVPHRAACQARPHLALAPALATRQWALRAEPSERGKNIEGGVIKGNPYDEAGRSPGAGAETSEEQADAAYADLLYTSMVGGEDEDPQGSWEDAMEEAKQGDTSSGWAGRKSKGGLSDALEVFKSLAGGAHIVKDEDGRV